MMSPVESMMFSLSSGNATSCIDSIVAYLSVSSMSSNVSWSGTFASYNTVIDISTLYSPSKPFSVVILLIDVSSDFSLNSRT